MLRRGPSEASGGIHSTQVRQLTTKAIDRQLALAWRHVRVLPVRKPGSQRCFLA